MAEYGSRDFAFTAWYLNIRRIAELLKSASLNEVAADLVTTTHLTRSRLLGTVSREVANWLASSTLPTLGELAVSGGIAPGTLFSHYDTYYCRGLAARAHPSKRAKTQPKAPDLHVRLPEALGALYVRATYSPEDLTSRSAWATLTGRRQLLLFGLITSVTSHEVLVTPIVIASLAPSVLDADTTYKASKWSNRLEISIDEIDSFDLVSSERLPRTESELEPLRRIPERDVKSAIAEIIGEPNVPKDWGGEFSDLFTTRLIVGGQRLPTAFLLKGPSQFREMTPASLGKNGDQIVRLFEEPADLLVLQHCHKVHRGIRDTMRAFASRTGNVRLFCIIDGYDTLRLLRAYGKCGLSPSDRLQSVF